jgi:hypothetical protein
VVRLPGIIVSCTITANVTDDRCLSDYAGALAVVGVVVILFVFCPLYVAQLLYASSVNFAAAFPTELAAI